MNSSGISRRGFLLASAALAASGNSTAQQVAPAAGEIVNRIRKNVGVPWRAPTVDTIVAGRFDTPVKGIATTMMATFDVIKRAAASGKNLVITHEPTFFMHQDQAEGLVHDPVYQAKVDFMREHDMVVFHFHDHWHAHRPDGIAAGMTRELGWEQNKDPKNGKQFTFPGIPLAQFAKTIQSKLEIRTMRVLGDPKLPINRVAASWGYVGQTPGIPFFAQPGIDLLIAGETREWELVEYAQDAITSGQRKALILLGHVVSEQAGMKYCAEWLKTFITDVPIEFVPAAEPFWSPEKPVG